MQLILKMATPQQRSWCVLQSAKKETVTAVQRVFRTQFYMEPPSRVSIYAWYKAANHNFHSFLHYGHCAQSSGRAGLSSRHLPCDSRSTYRVSARYVQNFESFSINWCRCEFLKYAAFVFCIILKVRSYFVFTLYKGTKIPSHTIHVLCDGILVPLYTL
jgi:hypothetical protein